MLDEIILDERTVFEQCQIGPNILREAILKASISAEEFKKIWEILEKHEEVQNQ